MTTTSAVQAAFHEGLRALVHEHVDLAVERLSVARDCAPEDPTISAFLASALFAAALPDASADAIARALELGPADYWPNLKAAELRLRLGDPTAAVDHFLAALRAAEPGTTDATAAQLGLVRARREVARSISHRAVMPRVSWLVGRRRPATARATRER